MLDSARHTVLLIEADTSLRRLITLGLRHRGMHVIEASSPTTLPVLEAQHPGLVVLDIDGTVGNDTSLLTEVQSHPSLSMLPLVLLAWEHAPYEQVTCLTKPFDARTLHTTVEQILVTSNETLDFKAQELLLATHRSSSAPSIWPLITAAGLLLAVIGLMIFLPLSALGLLIIIVALLWWSLDTKHIQKPLPIEMSKTCSTFAH